MSHLSVSSLEYHPLMAHLSVSSSKSHPFMAHLPVSFSDSHPFRTHIPVSSSDSHPLKFICRIFKYHLQTLIPSVAHLTVSSSGSPPFMSYLPISSLEYHPFMAHVSVSSSESHPFIAHLPVSSSSISLSDSSVHEASTSIFHYIYTVFCSILQNPIPSRQIFQYHFVAWPDFGVPKDPGMVLNYLRSIKMKQNDLSRCIKDIGPPIVHCRWVLKLHFFIADQVAQVGQPMLFK